jgi:thioredoxin reductase (NADPH)
MGKRCEMNKYDIVIIGGGPAGLVAGMYSCRAAIKTLLIEMAMPGGQAATTEKIENYPGYPEGISGADLMMKMDAQARKFGLEESFAQVLAVEQSSSGEFIIKYNSETITTAAVIIATGSQSKIIGVPGEEDFKGRGVSYCATCDGAFFQGKTVAVIGGGDSAIQEGLFLTRFADKVYIVHRRNELRATKVLHEKALLNPKIEFILETIVTEIKGQSLVDKIRMKNLNTGQEKEISVDGVFIYIGWSPRTQIFDHFIKLDEAGYIITDASMRTSREGVFAAGDVRQKTLRQVVTAVSDGAIAAVSAQHYIESKE